MHNATTEAPKITAADPLQHNGGSNTGLSDHTSPPIVPERAHIIASTSKDEHSLHSNPSEHSIHTQTTASDHGGPTHNNNGHSTTDLSNDVERNLSLQRTTSVRPRARPIPKSERRGLFAKLTVIAEVDNPYNLSNRTKWFLTFMAAGAGAAGPLGSSIIVPSLAQVDAQFDSPPAVTNLGVALFLLSMGIAPLWWSTFSERYGRRSVYLISFVLFTVFCIGAALSNSVETFIVMRILSGGAAASVQSVGAGTIADIWEVRERGRSMGVFYLGPLLGPFLAPIAGGALTDWKDWRASMWLLAIIGGVIALAILFCLPETLPRGKKDAEAGAEAEKTEGSAGNDSAPLERSSTTVSVSQKTLLWMGYLRSGLLDPLSIILLLRHPPILLTVGLSSVCFGAVYFLSVSIQASFGAPPYNYSTLIIGLLYIPNSIGYVSASLLGGRWVDHIMAREARRHNRRDERGKLIYHPEDRMRENAVLAGILFPGGMLWWGWAIQYRLLWIVPAAGNVLFGFGTMLVFGMAATMLTEYLPKRASSGIALNNFVRNFFSCAGALAAQPIVERFPNGYVFTVFGAIAFVSSFGVIGAMLKWGPKWRGDMAKLLLW